MTTVTPAPTPDTAPEQLTMAASCDRCGYWTDVNTAGQAYSDRISQAYVRVTFANGHDLLLCGHHYRQYDVHLAMYGVTVHDQRADIDHKPGVSAAS